MSAKPVPEGFHTATPYIIAQGASRLIDFMQRAFGAVEVKRLTLPDGTIMNSQMKIGDSIIMLGETKGEWKPIPSVIYLYVEDADAVYRRALDAGAWSISQPMDEFFGDRTSGVKDPLGNFWWIATHKEDVSREEIDRRLKDLAAKDEERRKNERRIGFH